MKHKGRIDAVTPRARYRAPGKHFSQPSVLDVVRPWRQVRRMADISPLKLVQRSLYIDHAASQYNALLACFVHSTHRSFTGLFQAKPLSVLDITARVPSITLRKWPYQDAESHFITGSPISVHRDQRIEVR